MSQPNNRWSSIIYNPSYSQQLLNRQDSIPSYIWLTSLTAWAERRRLLTSSSVIIKVAILAIQMISATNLLPRGFINICNFGLITIQVLTRKLKRRTWSLHCQSMLLRVPSHLVWESKNCLMRLTFLFKVSMDCSWKKIVPSTPSNLDLYLAQSGWISFWKVLWW